MSRGKRLPLAAIAMMMAAAPAALDAQGRRGTAAVFAVPVTTDMILAKPDAYAGQLVALSSGIDEVLSKTAFTVDQRKVVDGKIVVKVGKPLLVIAPTLEAALAADKYITIVGSVITFDAAAIASRVKDYQIDLPPHVAARYQGQTVLLATTIHSSTSAELTRKPAPAEPATKKPQAQSSAKFSVSETWAALPAGSEWGPISAVASDGKGSIVVLRRTFPSVFQFTQDGTFTASWGGEGLFNLAGAHAIRLDRDGFLWATDTLYNVVYKMTRDGKVILQVGKKGVTGGNDSQDAFDRPADVAVAANGDFFVADGYGNSRVVKFAKDGRFIKIIGGEKGTKPGQFDLVHSIVIDSKGRLLVGDRTNARVQVLDQNGTFIEQWTGLGQPYGLYITSDDTLYVGDAAGGTITIAKDGKPIDVIRDLGRPHWITLDANGAIYMADVRGFVKKIVRTGSAGR